MVRNLIACAGAAMVAGTASAAFLGIDIREDKNFDGVANLPADLRVFNIYASFDNNEFQDAVLSVGQPDAQTGFGINQADGKHADATLYQNALGGNTAPPSAFVPAFPDLAFDTFVTIGFKDDMGGADNTSTDPDFSFSSTMIFGGWFNSNPPSRQGEGTFNADTGNYETLIAQVGMTGLDAGAELRQEGSGPTSEFVGDIFTGVMTVNTQGPDGGADANDIVLRKVPTPGAVALFGIAGLAAGRRRR